MAKAAKGTYFETKTCSRCGGCGRYSYNQIDGDRCYGCGGSGITYTKRGAIAKQKFLEMRKILPEDAKVGDRLVQDFFTQKTKFTIAEILGEEECGYSIYNGVKKPIIQIRFKSVSGKEYSMSKGYAVEKIPSSEENKKMLEECIRYQFSLTKTGKERIRGKMSEEDEKTLNEILEKINQ